LKNKNKKERRKKKFLLTKKNEKLEKEKIIFMKFVPKRSAPKWATQKRATTKRDKKTCFTRLHVLATMQSKTKRWLVRRCPGVETKNKF